MPRTKGSKNRPKTVTADFCNADCGKAVREGSTHSGNRIHHRKH